MEPPVSVPSALAHSLHMNKGIRGLTLTLGTFLQLQQPRSRQNFLQDIVFLPCLTGAGMD